MQEDPTLRRIREARHEISEENDHDPVKLVAYYRELQEKHASRMAPPSSKSE
jgi:hypothetical protein